jgi:hypothetical protein
LLATNNAVINTYGKTILIVVHKLRRAFKWEFIKAPVSKAIIGADILHHFNFMVDIRNRKLIDKITNLDTLCIESHHAICSIKTYTSEQQFADIIKQFPSFIAAQSFTSSCAHHTVQYIETK